jgi:hypothetical protein
MKKLLAGTLGLVIAAAAVALFSPLAKASPGSSPFSQQPTIGYHWESLGVAAGAIIQSPVLKLENVSECVATADNSAGGSTRALNVDWMGVDGTTIVFRAANTVAIAGRGLTTVSATAATASLPTGVVAIPAATTRRMQFTLAAAGAAAGSLMVDCR